MDTTHAAKAALRARLIAKRKELSKDDVAGRSTRIRNHLTLLPNWANAHEVLLYTPIKNEVDTTPLLDELWGRSVRVLLPRCRPDEPGIMDVACVSCAEELEPGMYGIPEPALDTCPRICTCSPDIILVPGVGFDRHGHRLGFGAGFYDRFLAGGCADKALLIGLAYSFQIVDRLPAESWDIPMHAIITEDGIRWI